MLLQKMKTLIAWLYLGAVVSMFLLIAFFKAIEFYDFETTKIAVAGMFIAGNKTLEILKYFRKHRRNKATKERTNKDYTYSSLLTIIFFVCIPLAILIWQGVKPFSLDTFATFLIAPKIIITYAHTLVNDLLGIDNIDQPLPDSNAIL